VLARSCELRRLGSAQGGEGACSEFTQDSLANRILQVEAWRQVHQPLRLVEHRGARRMQSRLFGIACIVGGLITVAVLGWSVTVASAAAGPIVKVEGLYRIVSTDCYFAAGKCHARFDIEQSGSTLSDPSDKYFHGKVNGRRVTVGERFPRGTSEDGWSAVGSTSNGGKTVSGDFYDGIGGSGTFTMTYIGSSPRGASASTAMR
jgi:hypothetical protein